MKKINLIGVITPITTCLMLLTTGCSQPKDEISAPTSSAPTAPAPTAPTSTEPVITSTMTAEQAKDLFENINPDFTFAEQSLEYGGTTDYLYYADLRDGVSQVTINIGKRQDADKPLTNLAISIHAKKKLSPSVQKVITSHRDRYQIGFLKQAFPNTPELVNLCRFPVQAGRPDQWETMETSSYFFDCSASDGDGNPEHFEFVLRIMDNSYQLELNKRFSQQLQP